MSPWGYRSERQALPIGMDHRLESVLDSKFPVDLLQVVAHRPFGGASVAAISGGLGHGQGA